MSGQLVGTREALVAAGVGADMGLFSGVSTDMTGLVLQPMEGLLAHGAFVRPRDRIFPFRLGFGRYHSGGPDVWGAGTRTKP